MTPSSVSRGTLREAMRQLQQEGLLTAGAARGRLYVRHLGPKEISDIYAVRAALEAMAARALAQRADRAEGTAELRSLLHTMSEARADVDLEGRIEADLNFHRGLCRLTGNDTLMHTWESLEGSIRMSIMFARTAPLRTWTSRATRPSSTRSLRATPRRPPPPSTTTWDGPPTTSRIKHPTSLSLHIKGDSSPLAGLVQAVSATPRWLPSRL
jgi:DNA-binding GntR family transcriptional regulator